MRNLKQIENVLTAQAKILTDLTRREIDTGNAVALLDTCKVLINHYKLHIHRKCCCSKNSNGLLVQIREELRNLENFLIIRAVDQLGEVYVDNWAATLSQAWATGTAKTKEKEKRQTSLQELAIVR